MDLSDDDLMEILKIFEQSKFEFLHLEQGELKLSVGKKGYAPAAPVSAAPQPIAPPAPVAAAPAAGPWAKAATPAPAVPAAPVAPVADGLVAVTAPMVGKFYAQPSPADPPYVAVGSKVEIGGTLGLIEVMKVFTSVQAEVAGTIEQIVVTNGQSVEYGQTLFLMRPSA
jgi:acetyl-CoA carboxylase biotin carboxyl carrier protein